MLEPNIYSVIAFNLHDKVREMLDALDMSGQIDRDEHNAPHVISVDRPDPTVPVFKCVFIRNGRPESFAVHTRKKQPPFRSWREDDGYKRPERKEPENSDEPSRKERDRRKVNAFEHIMEQILPPRGNSNDGDL